MTYYWGDTLPSVSTGSCNIDQSPLRITVPRSAPRSALEPGKLNLLQAPPLGGAMTQEIRIPAGTAEAVLAIRPATGAAPQPVLSGPAGERVTVVSGFARTPAATTMQRFDNTTLVTLRKPRAGVWKVQAPAGTPAMGRIDLALPIPSPQIRARVARRGHLRRLVYRATFHSRDRLRFREEGRSVSRELGAVKRGSDILEFDPGAGSPGTRTIFALLERGGLVVRRIKVATYVAPKPRAVPRVRRLRAKLRRRGVLELRWSGPKVAQRYDVDVRLGDGRREHFLLPAKTPFVRLGRVGPGVSVRASVVVMNKQGRKSAAARLRRVAPKAPRRPRRIVVRL